MKKLLTLVAILPAISLSGPCLELIGLKIESILLRHMAGLVVIMVLAIIRLLSKLRESVRSNIWKSEI